MRNIMTIVVACCTVFLCGCGKGSSSPGEMTIGERVSIGSMKECREHAAEAIKQHSDLSGLQEKDVPPMYMAYGVLPKGSKFVILCDATTPNNVIFTANEIGQK